MAQDALKLGPENFCRDGEEARQDAKQHLIQEVLAHPDQNRITSDGTVKHTVKYGESLSKIAAAWLNEQGLCASRADVKKTVDEILFLNPDIKDKNHITQGENITLGKIDMRAINAQPQEKVEPPAPPIPAERPPEAARPAERPAARKAPEADPAMLVDDPSLKPYQNKYGDKVFNVLNGPAFSPFQTPGESYKKQDTQEGLVTGKRSVQGAYDASSTAPGAQEFVYDGKMNTGRTDGKFTATEVVGPNGEILERRTTIQDNFWTGHNDSNMSFVATPGLRVENSNLRHTLDENGETVVDFEKVNSTLVRRDNATGNYSVWITTDKGVFEGTADSAGRLKALKFSSNEEREAAYQAQWNYQKMDAQVDLEATQQEFDEAQQRLRAAQENRHKYGE